MSRAYVAGTFDTKGRELDYVAHLVRAAGVEVTTVDLGTGEPRSGAADVPADEVARWHPGGADAVFTGDRGSAVTAMAEAFTRFLTGRDAVGGVLGVGGSGNTALVTQAMRALPVGVPKVMVSTLGSGNVAPYVGASDMFMLHSVTDVAGLNRISRVVLGNAAHALTGMMRHEVPADGDKPPIALSMFGVTTPCVTALVDRLEGDYDCLVFHATGTGGNAMEKLVDDGLVTAVVDVTTTEVCDHVAGGILSAGEDRLGAIARTGVPYVGSCGALDMVNFGARDTVPEHYRDRNLYEHNAQVTLMRTTAEECERIAEFIAAKLNACTGEVRFLLPEGGVSMLDAPGQAFYDPAADEVLFGTLERLVEQTERRQLRRLPHNVNDPEFADAVIAAFDEVTTRS